ncbi:hypothetical protein R1sor_022406 [Riccia sorocarpa]|uniref:Uncharacterized protein n=1 Tax=Riccia sorocarpa TaxID=122646 RepID=A0ABD3GN30_9MARC
MDAYIDKQKMEPYENDNWRAKIDTAGKQLEEREATNLEDLSMMIDLRQSFFNSQIKGYQSQVAEIEKSLDDLQLAKENLEKELQKSKEKQESMTKEHQLQLQQKRKEYVQLQDRNP